MSRRDRDEDPMDVEIRDLNAVNSSIIFTNNVGASTRDFRTLFGQLYDEDDRNFEEALRGHILTYNQIGNKFYIVLDTTEAAEFLYQKGQELLESFKTNGSGKNVADHIKIRYYQLPDARRAEIISRSPQRSASPRRSGSPRRSRSPKKYTAKKYSPKNSSPKNTSPKKYTGKKNSPRRSRSPKRTQSKPQVPIKGSAF